MCIFYCLDIDECIDNEQHNCTDMEMCFNTLGSYKCCILGHHLNKETGNCEKSKTLIFNTSINYGFCIIITSIQIPF